MGTVVLDASVLIGFLNPRDVHHPEAIELAREWGRPQTEVLLPASVYSEILVHAMREGREELVERLLRSISAQVVPVDRSLARTAARLRAEYRGLRLPGALVLATAQHHAATLLTLDLRLRRIAEGNRT